MRKPVSGSYKMKKACNMGLEIGCLDGYSAGKVRVEGGEAVTDGLRKEWERLLVREEKLLNREEKKAQRAKNGKINEVKEAVKDKIPEKLVQTLNEAFHKAFLLIFSKGGAVIAKTFHEDELALEFTVNDFRVNQRPNGKSVKKLEQKVRKNNRINSCAAAVEGIGLGVVGIGLPDIPIFLGVLLKGIYETAVSFGYNYKEEKEQILILKMICAALADGSERRATDKTVEAWMEQMDNAETQYDFEEEVRKASGALSEGMLVSKFVQGFFIVGAIGGVTNPIIYRRVMEYVSLKYKKRYLLEKRKQV